MRKGENKSLCGCAASFSCASSFRSAYFSFFPFALFVFLLFRYNLSAFLFFLFRNLKKSKAFTRTGK